MLTCYEIIVFDKLIADVYAELLGKWCWNAARPGLGSTSSAARTAKESLCLLSCLEDQLTSAVNFGAVTNCSRYVLNIA